MRIFIVVALLPLFFSFHLEGAYNGSVSFTEAEKLAHRESIELLTQVAAACLEDYQTEHLDYYHNNCRQVGGKTVCLSKFYGERRYSKVAGATRPDGTPLEYIADALAAIGFPVSYMNQMEPTSCVGMAIDCLSQGFSATGQEEQWEEILTYTKANGVGGTALQDALSKLGWKTYYWNPAPPSEIIQSMRRWDIEEANWQSKGHHVYRYNNVMNRGTYWFNKVDDAKALVGFNYGEPELLQSVPFWVGTAHTGYHVFPGTYGDVVEAHSTRHITSIENLEFSRFSPFAKGGGPGWEPREKYRSGLIVIPPSK